MKEEVVVNGWMGEWVKTDEVSESFKPINDITH